MSSTALWLGLGGFAPGSRTVVGPVGSSLGPDRRGSVIDRRCLRWGILFMYRINPTYSNWEPTRNAPSSVVESESKSLLSRHIRAASLWRRDSVSCRVSRPSTSRPGGRASWAAPVRAWSMPSRVGSRPRRRCHTLAFQPPAAEGVSLRSICDPSVYLCCFLLLFCVTSFDRFFFLLPGDPALLFFSFLIIFFVPPSPTRAPRADRVHQQRPRQGRQGRRVGRVVRAQVRRVAHPAHPRRL